MSDVNKPIDPTHLKRLKTRGLGTGKEYEPFIKVYEGKSQGESVRVRSSTVGRVHHLLSGIELTAFVLLDWFPHSIDIREQYPIPINDSLGICQQLGIRHPQVRGKLTVVTTDLLVDFDNRGQLAVAVKESSALDSKRTLEKLQIEKAYWEDKGIEWGLFTEQERSDALRENLDWLRPYMDIDTPDAHELDQSDVVVLVSRVTRYPSKKITRLCGEFDDQYGLDAGYHLSILRFAVAHHFVQVPIDKPFHTWRCSDLIILDNATALEVGHVL